METRKISIRKLLIGIVAILLAIILFGYLKNPIKTNVALKTEAMSVEEIQNVGKNGIITEAAITNRLTGTGPFDSDDTAGNDSTEENDIVRSFDQITWTIESTMQLKDGTINQGLKGGKIHIKAELPASTANIVKWDLDSMKWAEDAEVSADGRIFTGSYTMAESKVTIPGKQTLVVVLKVLGAVNGTKIEPTFSLSLVGNNSGEEKTITDSAVTVSAKPSYNIELKQNTNLYKQVNIEENITGRVYGYFLGLQLYNGDNPDKGMKGIEFPKGNITFDIDLKLEKTPNGENNPVDITAEATPILYNYALNESTNTTGNISGRPMNGLASYSQYNFKYPVNNNNGNSDSVHNSGTINMVQQGNKLHVTINNYEVNPDGVFPKNRWENTPVTNNIGYFGAYYFQVLVPFTTANEEDSSSYYLTVADENFKATSLENTVITNQKLEDDDTEKFEFVRYLPGRFTDANWLKTGWNTGNSIGNGGLYTTYDQGDARATVGQTFVAITAVASNDNNSEDRTIYSANSLLKFDGEAFEISQIDGKVWNLEENSELPVMSHNSGNMNFQMLYAAKPDGTNWASDDEMKNAIETDLVYFKSLEELKANLGQNAKCIAVLWESISGTMGPGSDYALGLALKVTNKAQNGKVYQFTSVHSLYREARKLDRTTQTRTNPNAEFPKANITINYGARYIKTAYDENGDIVSGTHSGNYVYGQSLLIITGQVSVEKTVADISEGKAKVNYDLGRNETVVTYNVKPILKSLEDSTDKVTGITLTLTDTLPKGLKYIKGSSNSEYGEPTITENEDGTSTLVWEKGTYSLDEDVPLLSYKAAIDLTTPNGTSYISPVVVEADKLVKTPTETRTARATISITRLAGYSLYKDTETPIIDKNGEGSYNVVMLNMTKQPVSNFQLLDILPYNGDERASSFSGTYTITKIELSGNVTGEPISVDGLKIAITEEESVRNGVTAKDTNLGNGGIWQTVSNGAEINKTLSAFAITGELPAGAQLIAKVHIKTEGNARENQYNNTATAQTNPETAVIESPVATIEVIDNEAIVIVHHYIIDENGTKTTVPVPLANGTNATDETQIGKIDDPYTTNAKTTDELKVGYELAEIPNNATGTMKKEPTEVTYYYKLATEIVENTITKEAKANRTVDGIEILTQEDGKVTYTITYNASIKNYVGKAKMTLVDTLPAKIDVSRSNLAEGKYNEETNTITWEQTIENINTYTCENQTYTNTMRKVIEVVYKDQDVNAELVNVAKGTTVTYYPDEDPTKPGEEKTKVEAETEEPIKQEYIIDKMVEKVWDDNNNEKGKRPNGIEVQILANGEKVNSVVLSNTNNWKHIFNRLNKYAENGELIKYEVTEKEVAEKDLENYEQAKITVQGDKITIVNTYKGPGKIIVEYKDIDTNEDIPYIDENGEKKLYNYNEEGEIGKDYKTSEKDIPYYELVKIPENKEGKFKKEDQTIIYYYRKLPFNIGIDKTVKEITVNGESKYNGNSKLAKIEIPESKLANAEVIVKYRIIVKNTGKVDGTAEIVDTIPAEFEIASTNPTYWKQLQGGKIQTNVELKVGEEKELEVVLKWKTSTNNLGTTKNVVEVTNTDNVPKYPDNNPDDNISIAEAIISVKTGKEIASEILIVTGTLGLIVLLAIAVLDIKISNRKK